MMGYNSPTRSNKKFIYWKDMLTLKESLIVSVVSEIFTYRQTDRQKDRQMERHNGQSNRLTERQTDEQIDNWQKIDDRHRIYRNKFGQIDCHTDRIINILFL